MSKFIPQFEPTIKAKYAYEVSKQLASGWIGPGKMTKEVEYVFTRFLPDRYNLLTTSGTTAIMMAIKALNISRKKVILFPSYTFLAGANAAKFLGYKVKLIDINNDTLSMDYDKLLNELNNNNNVGAVIFVNHNGYIGQQLNKIQQLCFNRNIPLIEDSSQALGIPNAGTYGDISIISFSVPKIITSGQGGLVSTNNINYYNKLKEIRDHGDNWRKTKIHDNDGVNFKFNDILASYLYAQLKDFSNIVKQKEKIFNEYRKYIKLVDFNYPYTWMVLYRTKKAIKIINELKRNNIQAVQYYRPINDNPIYHKALNNLDIANKVYREIIYLPSSNKLTKKQIKKICTIINQIEKGK